MILMGLLLLLIQLNRQSGSVLAIYFADVRNLSASQIGTVIGSMYLASTIAQIPTGILFDRFGTRLTLSALGLLGIAGIILFALADSVSQLSTGRFLIGLGYGGVITGIYLLAAAWTSPERMASVSSLVLGIAGGVGGLLATAPLASMLGSYGLPSTFLLVAILTALITLIIFLFVRDTPAHVVTEQPAKKRPDNLGRSLQGVWQIMRDRNMKRLIVMGICFSAPFSTIGGLWAGPYLFDIYQLSQQQASYVLFAMVLAFNLGTLTYGPLDRIFNTRKWVILSGVATMIIVLLALVVFIDTALWLAVLLLVVFCFFTPFYATLMAHCRGLVPFEMMGRAITVISLNGLAGVFVMQFGTGWLMELTANSDGSGSLTGYRITFAVIAFILLLCGSYYATVRDVPTSVRSQAANT